MMKLIWQWQPSDATPSCPKRKRRIDELAGPTNASVLAVSNAGQKVGDVDDNPLEIKPQNPYTRMDDWQL